MDTGFMEDITITGLIRSQSSRESSINGNKYMHYESSYNLVLFFCASDYKTVSE